jgi:hypothetical protein
MLKDGEEKLLDQKRWTEKRSNYELRIMNKERGTTRRAVDQSDIAELSRHHPLYEP